MMPEELQNHEMKWGSMYGGFYCYLSLFLFEIEGIGEGKCAFRLKDRGGNFCFYDSARFGGTFASITDALADVDRVRKQMIQNLTT